MKYGEIKRTSLSHSDAVLRVKEEIAKEGFGVITEINFQKTIKEKIGKEMKEYLIMGACNPNLAYKAIENEQNTGLFLPCNIIVYRDKDDETVIGIVNPLNTIGSIGNEKLDEIALDASTRLKRAIDKI